MADLDYHLKMSPTSRNILYRTQKSTHFHGYKSFVPQKKKKYLILPGIVIEYLIIYTSRVKHRSTTCVIF